MVPVLVGVVCACVMAWFLAKAIERIDIVVVVISLSPSQELLCLLMSSRDLRGT